MGLEKVVAVEGTTASSPWKTISQWASNADGSSEYAKPEWGAEQVIGEPDTHRCGDLPSAWASASSDSQEDWLNLYYSEPVHAHQIIIYQTFNPDQVVKVDLVDQAGFSYRVYTKEPKLVDTCPYELIIDFPQTHYLTDHVIITVDQSQLGLGWNEIDAVRLIGERD